MSDDLLARLGIDTRGARRARVSQPIGFEVQKLVMMAEEEHRAKIEYLRTAALDAVNDMTIFRGDGTQLNLEAGTREHFGFRQGLLAAAAVMETFPMRLEERD